MTFNIDLYDLRRREVQALGAALSCRDWYMTEKAYNSLRDKLDNAGFTVSGPPTTPKPPAGGDAVDDRALNTKSVDDRETAFDVTQTADAIPAGMVRWDGGDRAPDDWDGGQVMTRDGSIYLHNNHPTGRWLHGSQRVKYYPHRLDLDIIAYTPKPPAGGDAGASFVDRVCEVLRKEQDRLDAECGDYLMDTSDCINVIRENAAALALPAPVVEGWRLVPIEPTEGMVYEATRTQWRGQTDIRSAWSAMLAASPKTQADGTEAAKTRVLIEKLREVAALEDANLRKHGGAVRRFATEAADYLTALSEGRSHG